jgi:PTH1 family peptidyl-tRNA hydrolase
MILIVGLGNPGKKFQKTRHNLGFMIVESLKLKIKSFSDWRKKRKLLAEISEGIIANKKIILAKPRTFMNLSGKAAQKLTYNLQLTTDNLWIVHDEIDLPLGKIRISVGRGAAGHKGVQSIIDTLGTKDFVRFRIGIKPKQSSRSVYRAEGFVLKKFNKKEEKIVKEMIKRTVEAIEFAIKERVEKAMSKYTL